MCGIAGILALAAVGERPLTEVARAMSRRIVHRGPDDEGVWGEGPVALAHRRLSIVDLSPAGHQPMTSACGRYVMVFNGEIYNYRDIRAEIEVDPWFAETVKVWRGHSDTEIILAAVARWGLMPALERLVGMFAIALWDRQDKCLHLVRDRLGEKPLYYGLAGKALVFASELKALRAVPGFDTGVDRDALALLMRHNCVPAPYSIHRGIAKLMPGCVLTVSDPARLPAPTPYWSLRDAARRGLEQPLRSSDGEAVDQLETLLKRAIGEQMVADVPLGAFLSGGIDSSTIVALMQAQSRRPVQTFTIGFHEKGFDEAQHAKAVARHLGTEHTELYVSAEQAQAVIPRLPAIYDEPFADSSQIPTFLVSELARRSVTVSLSGDAGDELFAGYNRYFVTAAAWGRMSRLPSPLRRLVAGTIRGVPPRGWTRAFNAISPLLPASRRYPDFGSKLHKFSRVIGATGPRDIYRDLVSHWLEPASLVLGAHEPPTLLTDPARQLGEVAECVAEMSFLDAGSYLPDDILVKVDRAAMAVSLETRVPFLDHRVVEFAWQVPLAMKLRDGKGKWLLRQVLHRHVPEQLFDRPKMGFAIPLGDWLRGSLRDWAEALLDEARLRREAYFDPLPIRRLWGEHLAGSVAAEHLLWDVLMFQAWLEENRS